METAKAAAAPFRLVASMDCRLPIIIIAIKTFLSQEASGTCDASQLPPDRLVSSIMGVVV